MKTLRIALLGMLLAAGLLPAAHAHGPRVDFSVNLGYPAYVAPPAYYPPPPPRLVYAPARAYYLPPPHVARPYGHPKHFHGYGHDRHPYRAGHRHHRHHHRH